MKVKYLFSKKIAVFLLQLFTAFLLFAERPVISELEAKLGTNGKVVVSWKLPENPDSPVTSLSLYRHTQPIITYRIMEGLTPLANFSPETTSCIDSISDSLSYYYAIIASTNSGEYKILLPAINATVTGVQRVTQIQAAQTPAEPEPEEKIYPAGTSRETPLPSLGHPKDLQIIDESTRLNVQQLVSTTNENGHNSIAPFVFEEDYFSPNGGDDYLLFDILRQTFAKRDYKAAIEQLETFTGTNLEKNVILRGTFYLGQSYYFTGNHQNAIRCFLSTSAAFPELSKKWIDVSLDAMN